jgi:hypothetical protein
MTTMVSQKYWEKNNPGMAYPRAPAMPRWGGGNPYTNRMLGGMGAAGSGLFNPGNRPAPLGPPRFPQGSPPRQPLYEPNGMPIMTPRGQPVMGYPEQNNPQWQGVQSGTKPMTGHAGWLSAQQGKLPGQPGQPGQQPPTPTTGGQPPSIPATQPQFPVFPSPQPVNPQQPMGGNQFPTIGSPYGQPAQPNPPWGPFRPFTTSGRENLPQALQGMVSYGGSRPIQHGQLSMSLSDFNSVKGKLFGGGQQQSPYSPASPQHGPFGPFGPGGGYGPPLGGFGGLGGGGYPQPPQQAPQPFQYGPGPYYR